VVSEESASLSPPGDEQTGRIDINTLILSIADRGKSKNVFKVIYLLDTGMADNSSQFYMDAEKNKVFVAKSSLMLAESLLTGFMLFPRRIMMSGWLRTFSVFNVWQCFANCSWRPQPPKILWR
jgi:hypothetical protein